MSYFGDRRSVCSSELKLCGVCGDVARSYHFGGLSCNSCKAFFRRSVQNDHYFKFECISSRGQCTVTKATRKLCQYCRMRQCFVIGMEKRWVMTDEQKRALLKVRSAKKNFTSEKTIEERNSYKPQAEKMTEFMTPREIKEIESIVDKYVIAYSQVPYRAELHNADNNNPGSQAMQMFGTLVRRFAFYTQMMPDFAGLPNGDQKSLLKGGMLEMCLLRGALVFDPVNNRWPNTNMAVYKNAPVLNLSDVKKMASSPVFQMHVEFIHFIKQLGVDELTIMLLVLVVLFTDRPGITSPAAVEKCQIHYTSMLKRYMNWRFGLQKSQKLFNKLLTKLSDLRELSESHNKKNLRFESGEISLIQNELQHLAINPYPEYNILNDEPGDIYEAQQKSSISQQTLEPHLECDSFTSTANTSSSNSGSIKPYGCITSTNESAPSIPIQQLNMRYSHTSESPESSNSSYLLNHRNNAPNMQNTPLTSLTSLDIQFMSTHNQIVNQAFDEPHIGIETIESDLMVDCYSHQEFIEALACLPVYCVDQTLSPNLESPERSSGCQTITSKPLASAENSSQLFESHADQNSEALLEELCRELENYPGSFSK